MVLSDKERQKLTQQTLSALTLKHGLKSLKAAERRLQDLQQSNDPRAVDGVLIFTDVVQTLKSPGGNILMARNPFAGESVGTVEAQTNTRLADYRKRNRLTPAKKLTATINRLATEANAKAYAAVTDKLVFCADLLGVSLSSDNGERAATRLENKLVKINKSSGKMSETEMGPFETQVEASFTEVNRRVGAGM